MFKLLLPIPSLKEIFTESSEESTETLLKNKHGGGMSLCKRYLYNATARYPVFAIKILCDINK